MRGAPVRGVGTSDGWRTHTEDLRGNRDVRDSGQHVDDHAILWEAMIYLSRHVAKLEQMLDEGDE